MNRVTGLSPDWYGHASTLKLRKHLEEERSKALVVLLSVCRESTDAKVSRRFAEYDKLDSVMRQLTKDDADGSADGIDD